MIVDDFERYPVDKYPSGWRTWPFQGSKANKVYKIGSENGNKFLSADDTSGLSVQILKDFYWKMEYYPILSWKWRARTLPKGGNETKPATNDSACGVYVVLSKARQQMIKFTWSTAAPVGTAYEKKPGQAYIVVKESGASSLNKWKSQEINILEEYKKYFKRDLDKNPVAIAVLTDGNATASAASCDYDDFEIKEQFK